ncbi:hypothetical protein FRC14_002052 [Serendipita sp. 396]|nr:hypothetical protein FRC14_002052 [Serendipita sp. 396]KAG8788766.1 hypothetical protein FRC15_002149 [Serendipita sp. 397]
MPNVLHHSREAQDGNRRGPPAVTVSSEGQQKECSVCGISSPVDRTRIAAAITPFECSQCSRGETRRLVQSANTTPNSRRTGDVVREGPTPVTNEVASERRRNTTMAALVTDRLSPQALQISSLSPGMTNISPTSPTTLLSQVLNSAFKSHLEHQVLLSPVPSLTNTRIPSRGYDCLYPGASFEGIQANRTKEHRVSVRIVDVNLHQSTISGFLTIHDLTDNHPEITTFFDGQIIGHQYGFITNDWGANETVDMTHWQHFAPFHHINPSDYVKPKMTFKNGTSSADRGFVFMRWKERFLVPDHRVKTINGASFAGFYYICLEFGSLMGNLHAESIHYHPPQEIEEEDEEGLDIEQVDDTQSSSRTGSGRADIPKRNRRSRSRNPSEGARVDDDKSPPRAYAYGSSPYYASTSSDPSTSPVTGANRIRRASGHGATLMRRRRMSIYTAGSVAAHVHEVGHHAHPYSSPTTSASHSSHLASHGASATPPSMPPRRMGEGVGMTLEEALAMDIAEEQQRTTERERERRSMRDSRSRSRSTSRLRHEDDRENGYGHAKKLSTPARLVGYYYHAGKDICDLYQRLELRHMPEKTRGSFEFR